MPRLAISNVFDVRMKEEMETRGDGAPTGAPQVPILT